jgi:branched-subunit amino acid transport protein
MTTSELTLIGGMVLVTFLTRYLVLAMSGHLRLSDKLLQALNYVPPAVLTAIVVPAVLIEENELWLGFGNPRIIGAIAALGIGLWRKNLLLTIVVGMGAFLLWQAALGS